MREILSVSRQAKSLEWDETQEKAIDRMVASGLSGQLGGLLTRLADNDDIQAYPEALKLIVARCRGAGNMRYMVGKQSLYEWLFDGCVTCNKRKHIRLDNNVTLTCPACAGVGVRKFTDGERAVSLGMPLSAYLKSWSGEIDRVKTIIESEVTSYSGNVRSKLRD